METVLTNKILQKVDSDLIIHYLFSDVFEENLLSMESDDFCDKISDQLTEYMVYEMILVKNEEYKIAAKNKKIVEKYLKRFYFNYYKGKKEKESTKKSWNTILSFYRDKLKDVPIAELELQALQTIEK